jgi:hypothetical protein
VAKKQNGRVTEQFDVRAVDFRAVNLEENQT